MSEENQQEDLKRISCESDIDTVIVVNKVLKY